MYHGNEYGILGWDQRNPCIRFKYNHVKLVQMDIAMDKVVFGINEPFGDFGMEKKYEILLLAVIHGQTSFLRHTVQ